MSWTSIFPFLSDDLIEEYSTEVSPEELAQLESWFAVSSVHNRQKAKANIVSVSLFWKHVSAADPELPVPNRHRLLRASRLGLVRRFAPFETYVEPLLIHGSSLTKSHPDVCFRVYLANDLFFLLDDLVQAGYEVHLMETSSIRYCPGGFWRFLPLAERQKKVTVMDSDRISRAPEEIARTRAMDESGLGLWRVPGYYNSDAKSHVRYRPILGGHFGAKGGQPIVEWLFAFIWHCRRGSMPLVVDLPGCGAKPLVTNFWPSYGVDEWWLLAIYPRLARRGVLTFVPTDSRSLLLPLDIEFTTWINSRSEMVYFKAGGGCC
jgi:hypothetical protein